jgi:membrane fusion protein
VTPEQDPDKPAHTGMFRHEAMDASRSTRPYGTVLLIGDRLMTRLAWVGMLLVVFILAFLLTFSTSRKVKWQGVVVPQGGTVSILAPSAGSISEVLVAEGQEVKAGQPLFVVSDARSNTQIAGSVGSVSDLLATRRDSLEQDMRERRLQLDGQRAPLRARIGEYDRELQAMVEQEYLQRQIVDLAEQTARTYAELVNSRYVSGVSARERQADLLDKRQRLAELRRQIASLRREKISAKLELDNLEVQSQRDSRDMQRNVAELGQQIAENSGLRTVVIRAQSDGTIGTVNIVTGQSVAALASLAVIIPAHLPLEVEMYAPSKAVGLMRVGMDVTMRYPAFPYQKFGLHRGKVKAISRSTMRADEVRLPESVLESGAEPLYRVRVSLDSAKVRAYGEDVSLRPGMLAEGDVTLERRRLYEWILDPLFTVTGRI